MLTERDKAILDFERTWWTIDGSKDAAISERFELSPARYYQVLHEIIDDPDALAHDPLVTRRLRRHRDLRRRVRTGDNGAARVPSGGRSRS